MTSGGPCIDSTTNPLKVDKKDAFLRIKLLGTNPDCDEMAVIIFNVTFNIFLNFI